MPKTIDIALATAKAQTATKLHFCMRIGPLPDSSYIGFTTFDRAIEYDRDDGAGSLTYHARTGADLSQFLATADLSVDNGEAATLVEEPAYPNTGITEAMLDRGDLTGATFEIFEVNVDDLTPGRHEAFASGPIGEVKLLPGGLILIEQRSWSQLLKQTAANKPYLKTCGVERFGSQLGEEEHPCFYGLAPEWVDFTVTGIGSESVRDFTASALAGADDYYAPGMVEWYTGDNAGMSREVEAFASGGVVALAHTTRNPIQVGDTGRIRRDCTKRWEGHNSCETYANRQWFRGQPNIPDTDSNNINVPGLG